MRYQLVLLIVVSLLLSGCATGQIAEEKYSKLESPQATLDFAKESVRYDDPKAFYYCLADYVTDKFKYPDFETAWFLGGKLFQVFLKAEIDNIEQPAPDYPGTKTAKVTIRSGKVKAPFFVIEKDGKWKIGNPLHYKDELPQISDLVLRGRLPWREGKRAYYRDHPNEWLHPKKDPQTPTQLVQKKLSWRENARAYSRTQPRDWFSPRVIIPPEPADPPKWIEKLLGVEEEDEDDDEDYDEDEDQDDED